MQILIIGIPLLCVTQIAPGLFVIDKENHIFESIMTLPLAFKQIFFGKAFFCFMSTTAVYSISVLVANILEAVVINGDVTMHLGFKEMLGGVILPMPMFYNQGMMAAHVSLNSKDSKACAMDIVFVSFLYSIPCLIQISCITQPWFVWGGVLIIYLVIEVLITFIQCKKLEKFKNKSSLSNFLKE